LPSFFRPSPVDGGPPVANVVPPVTLLPAAVVVPPIAIVVPPVTVVVPPVALLSLTFVVPPVAYVVPRRCVTRSIRHAVLLCRPSPSLCCLSPSSVLPR
jgi:hypothetical protein